MVTLHFYSVNELVKFDLAESVNIFNTFCLLITGLVVFKLLKISILNWFFCLVLKLNGHE